MVFPLITLYKLCPSSRRTSNTTDTLNLYQYHGRSHTCKPNTYYSDIHIYRLLLSLSHSSSSYATLRHSWPRLTTVYQQTTLFYLIIPRSTHLLPFTPVQPNSPLMSDFVDNYRCFANNACLLYNANVYQVYVKNDRMILLQYTCVLLTVGCI